jgi:hypothetical protein
MTAGIVALFALYGITWMVATWAVSKVERHHCPSHVPPRPMPPPAPPPWKADMQDRPTALTCRILRP